MVRDDRLWETSLRVAGNPHEEFLVARRSGRIVAYARAMVAESFLSVSEVGRAQDGAPELAGLIARVLTPREGDPLATPARTSEALRQRVAFRPPHDPELDEALASFGVSARVVDDPTVKWRCLDAEALARRLGTPVRAGEAPADYLGRVFPPGASVFWPSDRF